MNAISLPRFGPPDVLSVQHFADPEPRTGWVTVALHAAGLNWHDCLVRQGAHDISLPQILGADGAGVRTDTGDEVVILPSLWWGLNERIPGPEFQILGDHVPGTYAEMVSVPAENIWPKPRGWTWEQAAAIGLGGTTAYRALFSRGGLRPDETVLVLGAGSGVSTVAVSLAAIAGARIFVTSSSTGKLERARELGATGGVLYTDDDWPQQVKELAGERGIDLVIDSVAGSWPQALSVLNPGGRLVNFGATGSEQASVPVRPFYFGQYSILGTTMGSRHDFRSMLELVARDPSWRPPIDTVRPLDQAAQAHAQMERREHFGKLVLSVT